MECFPSPCFRSLRGAKRRSNLVAPRLTSQARQDCFATLAMTRLKCNQAPFPSTGENMECFPSPCSLSLRGAKRRSNLVALALASQARQDCFAALAMTRLKLRSISLPLDGGKHGMLPLTMFPVIARSEATKQSRSTTTYITSTTRLLRCARNDKAKMQSSSLSLDGRKHGMLPLTVFPVIARSEATKQSRRVGAYVTSPTRLLRCARNDKAKMRSSSLPLSLSLPRQGERGRTNYAVTTLNFRISPHP